MIGPTIFFVLIQTQSVVQIFTNVFVMTKVAAVDIMCVLYIQPGLQAIPLRVSGAAWLFFIIIMAITVLVFKSSNAWVYYETEIGGQRS
jgi:multiple sugar transport system permease protein